MNKNFSREDILKKHQTNIKSAHTTFSMAIVLGIIYVVRFFITKNFDFYFSLFLPELILKSGGTKGIYLIIIVLYFALFISFFILSTKNFKWLKGCLALYLFDFAAMLVPLFISAELRPDAIDVILHCFITVFLCAGICSERNLTALENSKELQ